MSAQTQTSVLEFTYPFKLVKRGRENSKIMESWNKESKGKRTLHYDRSLPDATENNSVYDELAAEGCETYFTYLRRIGLANDPGLIIIPSMRHYYYNADELSEVKAIVHLRQLNHMKQIREFLKTVYHSLAQNSYFIGSFIDRSRKNGFFLNSTEARLQVRGSIDPVKNGITSKFAFINMIYSLIDSKPNRYLTGKNVRLLLENSSMALLDMTEIKELTFFCAQKKFGS